MKEDQIDKDRFFTMAETYDRMVPYQLPSPLNIRGRLTDRTINDGID